MCEKFNYGSNGPFGDENGVRTKKLGPKQKSGIRACATLAAEQAVQVIGIFVTYATWRAGQAATQVTRPLLLVFGMRATFRAG